MGRFGTNADQLLSISYRLGDAVIDPAIWPEIMDQISTSVGAVGAALLQSDVRTADVPVTMAVGEMFKRYFVDGWHTRDVRANRGVPLLLRGQAVITDQDLVAPEEMGRLDFYAEFLESQDLKWFATVGFWAKSALWGLSIQRLEKEGPFETDHKRLLSSLSQRLTETATLSKAVGRVVLSGMTNALHLVKQPALALDRLGYVLDVNSTANDLFDDEIYVRDRRIRVRDPRTKLLLDTFTDQLRTTPDNVALPVAPFVLKRRTKLPLIIRILPVDGAARSPFLGARALLVLSDLSHKSGPQPYLLSQIFKLSPAEARLASLIAKGISPEQAGIELGISRETARNQLKAVFAKTETHRQSELVALLSRL